MRKAFLGAGLIGLSLSGPALAIQPPPQPTPPGVHFQGTVATTAGASATGKVSYGGFTIASSQTVKSSMAVSLSASITRPQFAGFNTP